MNSLFLQSLSIAWEQIPSTSYLWNIPALTMLRTMTFHKNITFLCGENGTGKSTLLESIAVAYGYNAEGGTRNYRFSTFDDVSELQDAIRLVRGYRPRNSGYFFRAESFFNVATAATTRYSDFPGQMPDYHGMSHGESFLSFLQSESREGLYLMDEPEAALSVQRQLVLISHMHQMALEGSQFIVATHSPILLGMPEAAILSFEERGIHETTWEETESYLLTKLFLENRDRLLSKLYEPYEDIED
ncbi:MAG: AAA family ATPase [Clostridia bacterium]|nr:AAA family ATPase [Clostridia bacterium]